MSSTEKTLLINKDKVAEEDVIDNSVSPESKNLDEDVVNPCTPAIFQYPLPVYFIICNEFCERFNYFGVRSILTLYLIRFVGLTANDATVVFHLFVVICYLSPLLGAIVADNWLGRFWTILSLSMVYCIGSIILSATSVPPYALAGPIVGLLLIGIGTGGIKPNVSAFGADQFPENNKGLIASFFAIFYLSINLGSFFALLFIPMIRSGVKCFDDNCYSLAFGVPAIIMAVSVIIFVAGKSLYIVKKPTESVLKNSFACIFNGIRNYRRAEIKDSDKKHFVDYADPEIYSAEFKSDIKQLGGIMILYLPFPIFWALFDQQGSRWTIQASRMDGRVLPGWTVLPDQMQALNPFLLVLLIPVFECCVYPLIERCCSCMRNHVLLKRLGAGMFIASLSFLVAMCVQFKIEEGLPPIVDPGNSKIVYVNTLEDCKVTFQYKFSSATLNPKTHSSDFVVPFDGNKFEGVSVTPDTEACTKAGWSINKDLLSNSKNASFDFILALNSSGQRFLTAVPALGKKHKKGYAMFRVMLSDEKLFQDLQRDYGYLVLVDVHKNKHLVNLTHDPSVKFTGVQVTRYETLLGGNYELIFQPKDPKSAVHQVHMGNAEITSGEVMTIFVISPKKDVYQYIVIEEIKKNIVPMMLMIPQYILISVGEILFSISGLAYSYAQAPASMKSVVQAVWLMCVGLGNIVVMIISEVNMIRNAAYEFLMYSLLMMLNVVLFILLAMRHVKKQSKETTTVISLQPSGSDDTLDSPEKKVAP